MRIGLAPVFHQNTLSTVKPSSFVVPPKKDMQLIIFVLVICGAMQAYACTSSSDCAAGQHCKHGTCAAAAIAYSTDDWCAKDLDCAATAQNRLWTGTLYRCIENKCRAVCTSTPVDTCTSPSRCGADGYCTPVCANGCSAPNGVCDIHTGKCQCVEGYAFPSCDEPCGEPETFIPGKSKRQCDDGNVLDNDGCSSDCQLEGCWVCTQHEHKTKCCPTGQQVNKCGACARVAHVAKCTTCGDNQQCTTCTDHHTGPRCGACIHGYEMSKHMLCVPVIGDSEVVSGEECDDGNSVGGDGCSATGQLEPGYVCTTSPCSHVCPHGRAGPECTRECDSQQHCSGHGVCADGNATCICDKGWHGPNCGVYCDDVKTCHGHGTCDTGSGSCLCDAAHSGPACLDTAPADVPPECRNIAGSHWTEGISGCVANTTGNVTLHLPTERDPSGTYDPPTIPLTISTNKTIAIRGIPPNGTTIVHMPTSVQIVTNGSVLITNMTLEPPPGYTCEEMLPVIDITAAYIKLEHIQIKLPRACHQTDLPAVRLRSVGDFNGVFYDNVHLDATIGSPGPKWPDVHITTEWGGVGVHDSTWSNVHGTALVASKANTFVAQHNKFNVSGLDVHNGTVHVDKCLSFCSVAENDFIVDTPHEGAALTLVDSLIKDIRRNRNTANYTSGIIVLKRHREIMDMFMDPKFTGDARWDLRQLSQQNPDMDGSFHDIQFGAAVGEHNFCDEQCPAQIREDDTYIPTATPHPPPVNVPPPTATPTPTPTPSGSSSSSGSGSIGDSGSTSTAGSDSGSTATSAGSGTAPDSSGTTSEGSGSGTSDPVDIDVDVVNAAHLEVRRLSPTRFRLVFKVSADRPFAPLITLDPVTSMDQAGIVQRATHPDSCANRPPVEDDVRKAAFHPPYGLNWHGWRAHNVTDHAYVIERDFLLNELVSCHPDGHSETSLIHVTQPEQNVTSYQGHFHVYFVVATDNGIDMFHAVPFDVQILVEFDGSIVAELPGVVFTPDDPPPGVDTHESRDLRRWVRHSRFNPVSSQLEISVHTMAYGGPLHKPQLVTGSSIDLPSFRVTGFTHQCINATHVDMPYLTSTEISDTRWCHQLWSIESVDGESFQTIVGSLVLVVYEVHSGLRQTVPMTLDLERTLDTSLHTLLQSEIVLYRDANMTEKYVWPDVYDSGNDVVVNVRLADAGSGLDVQIEQVVACAPTNVSNMLPVDAQNSEATGCYSPGAGTDGRVFIIYDRSHPDRVPRAEYTNTTIVMQHEGETVLSFRAIPFVVEQTNIVLQVMYTTLVGTATTGQRMLLASMYKLDTHDGERHSGDSRVLFACAHDDLVLPEKEGDPVVCRTHAYHGSSSHAKYSGSGSSFYAAGLIVILVGSAALAGVAGTMVYFMRRRRNATNTKTDAAKPEETEGLVEK